MFGHHKAQDALAVLTLSLLSSCAGGGGGGGPGAPAVVSGPAAIPAPSVMPGLTSAEYLANWGVDDIGASTAWTRGTAGGGILVAVIDDGVQTGHPELSGQTSAASKDIMASRNILFDNGGTHGSEIAGIIAAKVNGAATLGVAFDAKILGIRADDGTGGFSTTELIPAVDYAIAQGVQVINFSLGSPTSTGDAFKAALKRATDAGIIIVTSAGNNGDPEVNYPGRLSTDLSVSNGLMLNAGSHGQSGAISSFSNRAGSAANYYVTAPGELVQVPDFGLPGPTDPAFQICSGGICTVQGTSYAAPHLAGAVALLRAAFPSLTPAQVVNLILQSADDAGAAGVDAVYGHGRLNVAAAFQPSGPVSAPLTQNGAEFVAGAPVGITGAAFGDGFSRQTVVWQTVGFDAYDRTFPINLSAAWLRPGRPLSAAAPMLWSSVVDTPAIRLSYAADADSAVDREEDLLGEGSRSRPAMRTQLSLAPGLSSTLSLNTSTQDQTIGHLDGHFSLTNVESGLALEGRLSPRLRLTVMGEQGQSEAGPLARGGDQYALAARFDFDAGPVALAATAGSVSDAGAALGLSWTPALGAGGESRTGFVGAQMEWRLHNRYRLGAEAELGSTRLDGGGWLSSTETILTSGFALGVEGDLLPGPWAARWPGLGGSASLRLIQPLRVESGEFSVALPVADDYGRDSLAYVSRRFEPVPSGRELDLEAAYELRAGETLSFRAAARFIRQPGHVAGADAAAQLEIGARVRF